MSKTTAGLISAGAATETLGTIAMIASAVRIDAVIAIPSLDGICERRSIIRQTPGTTCFGTVKHPGGGSSKANSPAERAPGEIETIRHRPWSWSIQSPTAGQVARSGLGQALASG